MRFKAVQLICGCVEVSLEEFQKWTELSKADDLCGQSLLDLPPEHRSHPDRHIRVTGWLCRVRDEEQIHRSITQAINLCLDAEATDPRDKVYVLCGLSEDLARTVGASDYSKSVAEVYTSVAVRTVLEPRYQMTYWHLAQSLAGLSNIA